MLILDKRRAVDRIVGRTLERFAGGPEAPAYPATADRARPDRHRSRFVLTERAQGTGPAPAPAALAAGAGAWPDDQSARRKSSMTPSESGGSTR
jgi:hypothetical protein